MRKSLSIIAVVSLIALPFHAEAAQEEKALESLHLPSFAIFGFDRFKDEPKLNTPVPAEELEKILAARRMNDSDVPRFEKKLRSSPNTSTSRRASFIIPVVFYRSRHLFEQTSWSAQDMQEGRRLSRFFARLANRPDLEVFAKHPAAFRDGLINLRNWYASLLNHNGTLAQMVQFLDDGPYFGWPLPHSRIRELKLLQTMALPGRQERLALFTDNRKPEPMLLGVIDAKRRIQWARRLSQHPQSTIGDVEFHSPSAERVEVYGFVCHIHAGEGASVYLDKNLNLRFYFVTW